MDVVLLSRMIAELMPDLDSLSLPGLGTFRAEQVGASFSDKGFTINPPYRRLGFSSAQTQDGALAALYASSNGVSEQEADAIIQAFTVKLAAELRERKTVELPGLGRLRATREDHLFFVPDQDLDISPDACGLVTVSLKSHAAAVPPLPDLSADLSTDFSTPATPPLKMTEGEELKMAEERDTVHSADFSTPAAPPLKMTEGGTSAGVAENVGAAAKAKAKKKLRWYHYAGIAVGAVALLLAGFVAMSRLAPEFTDRLLYTPEQLAIINAPEDGTGLPR